MGGMRTKELIRLMQQEIYEEKSDCFLSFGGRGNYSEVQKRFAFELIAVSVPNELEVAFCGLTCYCTCVAGKTRLAQVRANKGCVGSRELSRLTQTAIESSDWIFRS